MAINESMSLSEIFATYDGAKKNLAQNVEAVKNSCYLLHLYAKGDHPRGKYLQRECLRNWR